MVIYIIQNIYKYVSIHYIDLICFKFSSLLYLPFRQALLYALHIHNVGVVCESKNTPVTVQKSGSELRTLPQCHSMVSFHLSC